MNWAKTIRGQWIISFRSKDEEIPIVLHHIKGIWHMNCASFGIIMRSLNCSDITVAKGFAIEYLKSYLSDILRQLDNSTIS